MHLAHPDPGWIGDGLVDDEMIFHIQHEMEPDRG